MAAGLDLPGLHKVASDLSDKFQSRYLWLVRSEYILLLLAATFSLDFYDESVYYLFYALTFLAGLVVLLLRSFTKPEQSWYRARAAAESIKTSAWRFAMLAHPYDEKEPQTQFLALVKEMLLANKVLSEGGGSPSIDSSQTTSSMKETRDFPIAKRLSFYLQNRVLDQRRWYIQKAKENRQSFITWVWASGAAYTAAVVLALSRIAFPKWHHVPIEPLIVIASSAIGWVQIKKHSELAASYTLTATEIGIAAEEAKHLTDEKLLSDFVNDTELAFSREHTQWVARQQTAG